MRKGFTLLELLIVIIIVGVLATIGFTQYTAVVERARGAEARQVLGQLRSICSGLYMADSDASDCLNTNLGIGPGAGTNIPGPTAGDCRNTHFFWYTSESVAPVAGQVQFLATRCAAAGKTPDVVRNPVPFLRLTTDYANGGVDTWNTNYGY
jgi:prepilin-type N-terminal cleavage/methylation domain-containing protein